MLVYWAVVGWVAMIPFAIGNGAFPRGAPDPAAGRHEGAGDRSLMLPAFVFVAIASCCGPCRSTIVSGVLTVSLTWPALTILFEFGFGHYVEHKPWDTLLADYNILKGRIWGLVLISEFAAPLLVGSLL